LLLTNKTLILLQYHVIL